MIRILYSAGRRNDNAVTSIGEQTYQASASSGAICALARVLLSAGIPDQAWEGINTASPGTISLRGSSIHRLAAYEVEYHPKRGVRMIRWKAPGRGATASPMRASVVDLSQHRQETTEAAGAGVAPQDRAA